MKNDINFDKTRYIELLKNEGTSLFNENREKDLELLSYSVILENQIYYNRKAEYIFLVEEYLRENAGEAGARMFQWDFFNLFRKDNQALEILEKKILEQGIEKLANFEIDSKLKEFSVLINDIVGSCEFLTFDPEDTYGITLDQFRDSIEKIFFKIQKCLDE